MPGRGIRRPAALARGYFALQAAGGAAWWVAVFTVPFVREATLGDLDPVVVAVLDVPLFVVASALVVVLPARAARWAAGVATPWTLLVTVSLALYATVTTLAGWGAIIMIAASRLTRLELRDPPARRGRSDRDLRRRLRRVPADGAVLGAAIRHPLNASRGSMASDGCR